MVGLQAAGKTTLLFKLKLGEIVTIIPTIGYDVETITFKNIRFTVWDLGGGSFTRSRWRYGLENTQAMIFVVDSSDRGSMAEASHELHKLMAEDWLRESALLVFANKQDLPSAMPVAEIGEQLRLQALSPRRCHIQRACAISGEGIHEGFDWLASTLST